MKNRHERLTKCGVVALAGIAVLGWIREPEKHQTRENSVTLAESRTTFPPLPAIASVPDLNELPGDPVSVHANDRSRAAGSVPLSVRERNHNQRDAVEAGQPSSDVNTIRQQEPANGGRHQGSPQSAEPAAETRSREPREEHPQEPSVTDSAVRNPERSPDDTINTGGQTPPSVVGQKRSKVRSAAIIVGAAAAGAAIGGATGGGKGAAIGAISGGAGGYVYDRMTRRKSVSDVPPISTSDTDQQVDEPTYDRALSLARRFGTPRFN